MELPSFHFRRRRVAVIGLFILLLGSLLVSVLRIESSSELYTGLVPLPASEENSVKTSRLHYLIPSSFINEAVCAGIVSALVNRYPIPTIIGYKGENEFDAADHLAKLRLLKRYLSNLNAEDDDLVLVVDSLDVVAQLPVEVMLERYFEMRAQSEQRLADQRGLPVAQLHELGIKQTILYGAGKVCFIAPDEPLCPLMPASKSYRYRYGVKTEKDGVWYRDSRYLNSGSIMGPVSDLRRFVYALVDLVEADDTVIEELDPQGKIIHHMDQWFTATLYVRQEFHRALDMNSGVYPGDLSNLTRLPKPRQGIDDTTEYHVFVDFESSFTQTRCWNGLEIHSLQYKNHDLTASVKEDFMGEGPTFQPHDIQMPVHVYQAFGRVWENLRDVDSTIDHNKRSWIQGLKLGTNIASERIFAFYHQTCDKTDFLEHYQSSWFYPFVTSLLRMARKELQDDIPLHTGLIDGRKWIAARHYPANHGDDLGGVFTDLESEPFLDLGRICQLDLHSS